MLNSISKKDKLIIYSRTAAKIFRGGSEEFSSSKPRGYSLWVRACRSLTGSISPVGRM